MAIVGNLPGSPAPASSSTTSLVSLADAKAQLNFRPGYTTDDAELQGFIDAATPLVEDIAGVILPRTIVGETYDGGVRELALRSVPVISITSVTETVFGATYPLSPTSAGTVTDDFGYELVDPVKGIVARRGFGSGTLPAYGGYGGGYGGSEVPPYSPDSQMLFLAGQRGVTVSYVAGYQVTPPNVRLGALLLVQHLWQSSQNGKQGPQFNPTSGEMMVMTSSGYAVPNDVREMLLATPTSPQRVTGIW